VPIASPAVAAMGGGLFGGTLRPLVGDEIAPILGLLFWPAVNHQSS
jgi:hypothetical protein